MFGYASDDLKTAYVREDLPAGVREFVVYHETYHLRDTSTWWVWREIKANAYGALHRPVGFLFCLFLSLQLYRVKYYVLRLCRRRR